MAYANPYTELASEGEAPARVGHALITMVEPHPGHEREYNRWYEDDHFISGALDHPWMYSGRRWVATRDLQQLRYPADTTFTEPITAGCYLGTYWVVDGRKDHHKQWTYERNNWLTSRDRSYREFRTHVFTSFQDLAGSVRVSDDVPSAELTLIDANPGLVLQVVDAPDASGRDALERWLLDEYLPARVVPGSPVEIAMVWRVNPPDSGNKPEVRAAAEKTAGTGNRLTILWFLGRPPIEIWDDFFVDEQKHIAVSGKGRTVFVAPFIPAKMGTDAYVDQLR